MVKEVTISAVKEKFANTWEMEWRTEFTKDWKERIEPAYSLSKTMNQARMLHWLWLLGILASFAAGLNYTLFEMAAVTKMAGTDNAAAGPFP